MRLVLDVNVWISGLLWGGSPRQIVNLAKSGKITIFVSEPILSELAEVLVRAKFQARMRSLDITADDLLNIAQQLSENCVPVSVNIPQLRDPDDAVILGTAIAAKAMLIVSGDLDLLVLKEFANIPILTPNDFFESASDEYLVRSPIGLKRTIYGNIGIRTHLRITRHLKSRLKL